MEWLVEEMCSHSENEFEQKQRLVEAFREGVKD